MEDPSIQLSEESSEIASELSRFQEKVKAKIDENTRSLDEMEAVLDQSIREYRRKFWIGIGQLIFVVSLAIAITLNVTVSLKKS